MAKIYNWTIFGYLTLITILTLNNNIAFGGGLGDITYLIVSGFLAISHFIIILIIYRIQKEELNLKTFLYVIGSMFLLTAIWLTWSFTFGRGIEYPWNGNIFLHNPF